MLDSMVEHNQQKNVDNQTHGHHRNEDLKSSRFEITRSEKNLEASNELKDQPVSNQHIPTWFFETSDLMNQSQSMDEKEGRHAKFLHPNSLRCATQMPDLGGVSPFTPASRPSFFRELENSTPATDGQFSLKVSPKHSDSAGRKFGAA